MILKDLKRLKGAEKTFNKHKRISHFAIRNSILKSTKVEDVILVDYSRTNVHCILVAKQILHVSREALEKM